MTRDSQHHESVRTATIGRTPGRLTERQVEAIKAAMRLFVEEDLERGIPPQSTCPCSACGHPRFAPGFVVYGDIRLCNECATDYEISRAQGVISTIDEFVSHPMVRTGANSAGAPSAET